MWCRVLEEVSVRGGCRWARNLLPRRSRGGWWLAAAGVETRYVEPGSPCENGNAESHRRLRDELTNRETFTNLAEAKYLADAWRLEYNQRRTYSSLGYRDLNPKPLPLPNPYYPNPYTFSPSTSNRRRTVTVATGASCVGWYPQGVGF